MTEFSTPFCGPAPFASELASAWNFSPPLLIALGIFACAARLSSDKLAFWLGWGVVVAAFVSPLCALSVALFSARALHHLLLLGLAAPLLGLAFPRFSARMPLHLALISTLGALLLWHIPVVYSAAWRSEAIYWLMQLALLLPATALWAGLLRQGAAGEMLGPFAALAGLTMGMGFIGAVLTFAPRPLYGEHDITTVYYGLTALEDQQLAGLLMWVPGFVPMLVIAGYLLRKIWAQSAAAPEGAGR